MYLASAAVSHESPVAVSSESPVSVSSVARKHKLLVNSAVGRNQPLAHLHNHIHLHYNLALGCVKVHQMMMGPVVV